jgi:hypothetical protein
MRVAPRASTQHKGERHRAQLPATQGTHPHEPQRDNVR